MYFGSYTCLTGHILILRILYLYYEAYTCIKVPVGTTGLILILQNLYLFFQYGSTRRYYRYFTCTKVPVGTIERIERYLKVLQNRYRCTRRYYKTDTEVPVGTTGLILILVFLILFLYYGAYTCISYLILVLQSIYLSYGSCTCITELILVQKYP